MYLEIYFLQQQFIFLTQLLQVKPATDGAPWCLHMHNERRPFIWADPEGITQAETHLLYNPKATVVLF